MAYHWNKISERWRAPAASPPHQTPTIVSETWIIPAKGLHIIISRFSRIDREALHDDGQPRKKSNNTMYNEILSFNFKQIQYKCVKYKIKRNENGRKMLFPKTIVRIPNDVCIWTFEYNSNGQKHNHNNKKKGNRCYFYYVWPFYLYSPSSPQFELFNTTHQNPIDSMLFRYGVGVWQYYYNEKWKWIKLNIPIPGHGSAHTLKVLCILQHVYKENY